MIYINIYKPFISLATKIFLNLIGAYINSSKSFRTLSPSPEGEYWDEGKIECKNFWND